MNTFTVSFFGHRQIDASCLVDIQLKKTIQKLLVTKEYIEFLVGRDGAFDQLVSSAVRRCKRTIRKDNSSLVLVLPYMTSQYKNNPDSFHDYYDDVEICSAASEVHYKAAHSIRNRSMIDRSDLVVFWVQRPSGGAYQAMQYAVKSGKNHINLYKEDEKP